MLFFFLQFYLVIQQLRGYVFAVLAFLTSIQCVKVDVSLCFFNPCCAVKLTK